jgi:hypothetical protein
MNGVRTQLAVLRWPIDDFYRFLFAAHCPEAAFLSLELRHHPRNAGAYFGAGIFA